MSPSTVLTAPPITQHVQVAIRATPEQIWAALTDGNLTPAYYFGFRADYDLTAGADLLAGADPVAGVPYRYTAGGAEVITGTVLEVEPGRRLRSTFNGRWDAAVAALPESTVTFTLSEPDMPMPGVTMLECRHEGLPATGAAASLEVGWVTILSGLKTLLETGAPLVPAPPA